MRFLSEINLTILCELNKCYVDAAETKLADGGKEGGQIFQRYYRGGGATIS